MNYQLTAGHFEEARIRHGVFVARAGLQEIIDGESTGDYRIGGAWLVVSACIADELGIHRETVAL